MTLYCASGHQREACERFNSLCCARSQRVDTADTIVYLVLLRQQTVLSTGTALMLGFLGEWKTQEECDVKSKSPIKLPIKLPFYKFLDSTEQRYYHTHTRRNTRQLKTTTWTANFRAMRTPRRERFFLPFLLVYSARGDVDNCRNCEAEGILCVNCQSTRL